MMICSFSCLYEIHNTSLSYVLTNYLSQRPHQNQKILMLFFWGRQKCILSICVLFLVISFFSFFFLSFHFCYFPLFQPPQILITLFQHGFQTNCKYLLLAFAALSSYAPHLRCLLRLFFFFFARCATYCLGIILFTD
jgi:hypothetical protein